MEALNEIQRLRLSLYEKEGDLQKAQKVENYILNGCVNLGRTCENETHEASLPDGVYLCFKDGTYIRECDDDEEIDKDSVKAIGVVWRGIRFMVSLYDAYDGCTELMKDDELYGLAYPREYDAIFDYNGLGNTRSIVEKEGLSPNIKLEEGEYIPALGELTLIGKFNDEINRLLGKYGTPLECKCYWSSTEYSGTNLWYQDFNSSYGNLYIGTKSMNKFRVRPVSVFNPAVWKHCSLVCL